MAELALQLERKPADADFEEILEIACTTLRNIMGAGSEPFRRSSDPELLRDIVVTLTLRYAHYVPAMFGTRLSPRLADSITETEEEMEAGSSESAAGDEARRQARFLGDVCWLGLFLLRQSGTSAPFLPRKVMRQIAPRIRRGKTTSSGEALADWAALWLLLALVDLGGCGALLRDLLGHWEFASRLDTGGPASRSDGAGGTFPDTCRNPAELAGYVRDALEGLFPRQNPPTDGVPPTHGKPLLASLLQWVAKSGDEASRHGGEQGRGTAGDASAAESTERPTPAERADDPGLTGLATAWLGIAVCLEIGLLRRRHLQEHAPWRRAIDELWRTTREHLFRALARPHAGCPLCPDSPTNAAARDDGTTRLLIDSLWLNAYLLHRITFEMDPEEILDVHFPDRYLAMVFFRRFAQLAAHVCWNLARRGDEPGENPPQVLGRGVAPVSMDAYTTALVDVVDVYAHHVLEVPFEVHVGRYLRHFLDSQAALYVLKDHYRDHLYHVIDVFLLGDFLLRARLGEERVLLAEVLEDRLARAAARSARASRQHRAEPPPRPDLWKNWCVAALCHDLGYPLLVHREALRHSEGAPIGETLRSFVGGLQEALRGHGEQLEARLAEVFSEGVCAGPPASHDHGAISAIMVHDNLRQAEWAQRDGPLLSELRPATVAIFLHGLVQRAIPVEDAPLAYFLAFCDEVQDWGRARPARGSVARDITWAMADPANWQLRAEPTLLGLELAVDRLEPTGAVLPGPSGETARRDEEARMALAQVYRDEAAEMLDPIFLWISKARNFERLAAHTLPWRPRLCIVTPIPERLRRLELSYHNVLAMVAHRFEEFNLRAFVHHLARAWDAAHPRERRKPVRGHQEAVLLDLALLAEDRPLRAFETEAGYKELARAIEGVIREAEEGYRQRGRALWRLRGAP